MEHGRSAADFDDLLQQVRQLTALVAEQQATIAAQHEALARAQEQLILLKKALFSPRRERYVPSPDQKLLFVAETPHPLPPVPVSSAVRPRSKPKHRRRFLIPSFCRKSASNMRCRSRNVRAVAVGSSESLSASMSPGRSN